jgi:hypothetical protein
VNAVLFGENNWLNHFASVTFAFSIYESKWRIFPREPVLMTSCGHTG